MVEDLIKRHMERLPTCARLYYSGIGNRRYKRASTQSGPGEPLVFKDLAERELRALESELRGDLDAANARITALQSERDALVNSVAAGGKGAVEMPVDADLVLRCQELEELATRGESDQTALNRLADTYLLDISAHDRKAMARNQTHHEAMRFVISAAASPGAALENGDELSLQAQYEDACIVANMNARDAERYRWLRLQSEKSGWHVNAVDQRGANTFIHPMVGEHLDAAIDAALSQQKAGERSPNDEQEK